MVTTLNRWITGAFDSQPGFRTFRKAKQATNGGQIQYLHRAKKTLPVQTLSNRALVIAFFLYAYITPSKDWLSTISTACLLFSQNSSRHDCQHNHYQHSPYSMLPMKRWSSM